MLSLTQHCESHAQVPAKRQSSQTFYAVVFEQTPWTCRGATTDKSNTRCNSSSDIPRLSWQATSIHLFGKEWYSKQGGMNLLFDMLLLL